MDKSVQNNRTAMLIKFVAVSGLLTPRNVALRMMRVITIHAAKATILILIFIFVRVIDTRDRG